MKLEWSLDPTTYAWAQGISLIKSSHSQKQYDGGNYRMWEDNWKKYILTPGYASFCRNPGQSGYLIASPSNIIQCFREGEVLQALVLVVAWGGMVRVGKRTIVI
jgi:hypothetical protein